MTENRECATAALEAGIVERIRATAKDAMRHRQIRIPTNGLPIEIDEVVKVEASPDHLYVEGVLYVEKVSVVEGKEKPYTERIRTVIYCPASNLGRSPMRVAEALRQKQK